MRISRARSRWCTSASRPTPSDLVAGAPVPLTSRTTAKSTRCGATSTGWRRGRRVCPRRCSAATSTSCGRSPTKASPTSACFDNALEFLFQGGYSLAHAMMMMIPEAWAGNPLMDEDRRAFYEYNAAMMEPWTGPAAIRLHQRPPDRRHARTATGCARRAICSPTTTGIIMASEMGVLPIPGKGHRQEWRLQAGQDAAGRSRRGRGSFPTRN